MSAKLFKVVVAGAVTLGALLLPATAAQAAGRHHHPCDGPGFGGHGFFGHHGGFFGHHGGFFGHHGGLFDDGAGLFDGGSGLFDDGSGMLGDDSGFDSSATGTMVVVNGHHKHRHHHKPAPTANGASTGYHKPVATGNGADAGNGSGYGRSHPAA